MLHGRSNMAALIHPIGVRHEDSSARRRKRLHETDAGGWKVWTDYVPGTAVQAIVEKAEALEPDLIVMGTRGRSPLGSLVLGSVANGVLGNCKIPVLLIR